MLPAELARLSQWAHVAVRSAAHGGAAGLVKAVSVLARHTGLPVTLVAAGALVVSFRLARRAARLAVEFALALAMVLAATKLGWIRW